MSVGGSLPNLLRSWRVHTNPAVVGQDPRDPAAVRTRFREREYSRSFAIADNQRQYIELTWPDVNLFEEGWRIERHPVGMSIWQVVDTIAQNSSDQGIFWDTAFSGSETYVYRVTPVASGQNPAYSPETIVKAVPHWPRDFHGKVIIVDCGYNEPAELPDSTLPGLARPSMLSPYSPEDPPAYPPCTTNSVCLLWQRPSDQAAPIAYYKIRETGLNPPFPIRYHITKDTTIEVCHLERETHYFFDICAFDIAGDSSDWHWVYVKLQTGNFDYCSPQGAGATLADPAVPGGTTLHGCAPNPFNHSTDLSFTLATTSNVRVDIYDILGRKVRTLSYDRLPAGEHEITWCGDSGSGATLATGVYFVRFEAGGYVAVRKMVLLK